jgi:hypothetical protein
MVSPVGSFEGEIAKRNATGQQQGGSASTDVRLTFHHFIAAFRTFHDRGMLAEL